MEVIQNNIPFIHITSSKKLSSLSHFGNLIFNMQKVQQETTGIMEQLIQYYLNHQMKQQLSIQSFSLQITESTHCHTNRSTSTGSPNISSQEQCLSPASSLKQIKSIHKKLYTEDNCYSAIETPELLNRTNSDANLKASKERNETQEGESVNQRRRHSSNSQRTIESVSIGNSKEKKIRGFNFRNKIEMKESYLYQAKQNTSSNNQATYDHPYTPSSLLINDFNTHDTGAECIKPQMASTRPLKQWTANVSLNKSNQLQQRIKADISKLIHSKKRIETN